MKQEKSKDWHTLARGVNGEVAAVRLPSEKDVTAIRDIPGASLFECEAHAKEMAAYHAAHPTPGVRFLAWKNSIKVHVLPTRKEHQ